MNIVSGMTGALAAAALVFAPGCAWQRQDAAEEYTHRFSLPADQAAKCFARNAELHSSALVASISAERGGYAVSVHVRNGTPYALAHITPAGMRANGIVDLYVRSSGGNRQLLDALVEGC